LYIPRAHTIVPRTMLWRDTDIPLPDLTFTPSEEPDEMTRGRLLLRGALNP
jgi:hypothetical protein